MAIDPEVIAAKKQYEKSKRDMLRFSRSFYPRGARVYVFLGRGWVRGIVVRHGRWWSDPDAVYIENEKTGKTRRFMAGFDNCEVISRPKKEDSNAD